MQVREKVGKLRNTVFFQWFEAPEGRKVGSLKRRVQSQLVRWEMKNSTPLWREAHFQVKMYKTPQCRTTFGSWDVEKERRQAPEPQPEPRRTSKSWWNRTPVLRKERWRRETSTGTPAKSKRNQQIMMKQNPFPEERKKGEGRQAPEPQPEPRGPSKSSWNRTPFLKKKEERRRETSNKTPAGTRRSQQIMREQRPFLARIENPIQLKSCLGKTVHRYRSLSLHLLLHVACWNNILSLTKNMWEVHAEPQDLDMWFLAVVIFSWFFPILWSCFGYCGGAVWIL